MATPPPRKPLTTEAVPGAPGWLERLLEPLNGFIKPVADCLDRGLTFRENFRGEVRAVTITAPDDWQLVTTAAAGLGSGWASAGADQLLAWRKTLIGDVQVRGAFNYPSGTPSSGAPLITFPSSAYTPARREVFNCRGFGNGATSAVLGASTGVLRWLEGSYNDCYANGDVWWTASDRTPSRWGVPVDVRLGTPQRPFPARPGHVQVLRAVRADDAGQPVPVEWVDWTPLPLERQGQGIRLHRVWGLPPTVACTLTLLVLPE